MHKSSNSISDNGSWKKKWVQDGKVKIEGSWSTFVSKNLLNGIRDVRDCFPLMKLYSYRERWFESSLQMGCKKLAKQIIAFWVVF